LNCNNVMRLRGGKVSSEVRYCGISAAFTGPWVYLPDF